MERMNNAKFDNLQKGYKSKAEAEKAGIALGLKGSHTHKTEQGEEIFMPGPNHQAFMKAMEKKSDGRKMKTKFQQARDEMYRKRLQDMGSYRKYSEKKKDHPPSAHKKGKKKGPYMDGIQADHGTIGRSFDEVL